MHAQNSSHFQIKTYNIHITFLALTLAIAKPTTLQNIDHTIHVMHAHNLVRTKVVVCDHGKLVYVVAILSVHD